MTPARQQAIDLTLGIVCLAVAVLWTPYDFGSVGMGCSAGVFFQTWWLDRLERKSTHT